ncbi:MAG: glycosyltransferase family 2 protein [Deltaproteobacteria bacterium]|nr:glycosyltransferase family 2 protein [Deltaproteobacteria bacterium]
MKHLVVIPAHNEEETIYEVVTRSLQYADVSVTDDGSLDQTADILKSIEAECRQGKRPNNLHIIQHLNATHIPQGIQDGLIYAVAADYDFIVTMDAGLSHDPDALPAFLNHDQHIDVVIGSRRKTQNVPLYRRAISLTAAAVVNYALSGSYFDLSGPGIRDCTSGYRRYSQRAAGLIAKTDLKSKAFDFHMEALALCCRAGMTVEEIPIRYVFSNSSFNGRVLKQAIKFGMHLISTKRS